MPGKEKTTEIMRPSASSLKSVLIYLDRNIASQLSKGDLIIDGMNCGRVGIRNPKQSV